MELKLYVIIEYLHSWYYNDKCKDAGSGEIIKPYNILKTFSDIDKAREYLQFLRNEPDQHNGAPWSYALEEL